MTNCKDCFCADVCYKYRDIREGRKFYCEYFDDEVYCPDFFDRNQILKLQCKIKDNDVKDDIDIEKVKKFILSNFEIRSANSTVSKIAADSRYIFNCIVFGE